jgi:hypothetical protein
MQTRSGRCICVKESETPPEQSPPDWATRDHLIKDDIAPLIRGPPDVTSEVADYIQNEQLFQVEHRLLRINQALVAIRDRWRNATPLQIYVAFDLANCCSDDLLEQLGNKKFRAMVDRDLRRRLGTVRTRAPAKRATAESESSDSDDSDFGDDSESPIAVVRKRPPENTVIDPCPAEIDLQEWRSWSSIHRHSYLQRENDQNAYLYRNPPAGVEQRIGPWTAEEKAQFLARLKEVRGDGLTVDGQWGLFSVGIPGRVGYQCSNFYRQLLANGELQDANYVRGEDGKLHHIAHLNPEGKRSRTRTGRASAQGQSRYEQWASANPMPDSVDPLTSEKMRVPTLSPAGHVLDYTSWMRLLQDGCADPYTGKPVKKRELIVLTHENYDQLKEKIKNIDP